MTIYDIAKLANCSASTVSRVINKRDGVGERKRREIEAPLKEHNYIPDENARSLVMQTSNTIGILVDGTASEYLTEGIIRIEYELMEQGYFCFIKRIAPTQEGITDGLQALLRYRVVGALFMGVTFRNEREYVSQEVERCMPSIPIVMVNQMYAFPNPNIYAVGTDERTGFENSVNLLVARGCRNIALLLEKDRASSKIIRSGFDLGIRNHPGVKGLVLDNLAPTTEGGLEICKQLLAKEPNLDGIIACQGMLGVGVLYGLHDMGIQVPKQIAMITEGSSNTCSVCRPTMTSLDTMLTLCATISANTILDVLKGRSVAHSVNLQLEIHERSTTQR